MPILGQVQPNLRGPSTASTRKPPALGAKDLNSASAINTSIKGANNNTILKSDQKQNILKSADQKQKNDRPTTRQSTTTTTSAKPDPENNGLKRSVSTSRRPRKTERAAVGDVMSKLATSRMGTIGAGHSRRHSLQVPLSLATTRPAPVAEPQEEKPVATSWDALAAQLEEQFNIHDDEEIATKAIERTMNEGHSLPPFPANAAAPVLDEEASMGASTQSLQKTPPKIRLRPLLLPTKHRVSSSLSIPRTSSTSTQPETPRRITRNTPSPSPSPPKRKQQHPSPMKPVIRYSPKSMRWVNLRNPERAVPASIIVGKPMAESSDPSSSSSSNQLERTPTKSSSRRAALLKRDVINPGSPMATLMSPAIQPQAMHIPADLVPFIGKKAAGGAAAAAAAMPPSQQPPSAQDFAEFLQKAKVVVVSEAGSENGGGGGGGDEQGTAAKRKRKRGKKVKAPMPPAEPEVLDLELLKKKFTSPPDEVSCDEQRASSL